MRSGSPPESPIPHRALFGAAVGAAWIAGLYVAEPLVGSFAIVTIAEGIIVRSPGWLSTAAISLLGFYATPVLVACVVGAIVGLTALAAVLRPIAPDAGAAVAIGTASATFGLFFGAGEVFSLRLLGGVLVATLPPYLVVRGQSVIRPIGGWKSGDRRQFLQRIGSVSIAGVVSLAGIRVLLDRLVGRRPSERVEEPLERSVSPPVGDPRFDFDGMPSAVTSPEEHYVVDINVRPPIVDPETWTLDVEGAVETPYSLSYDELIAHGGSVEQTTTMVCISNQVGGELIGTGHWTGVQLSDLVDEAAPSEGAVSVVTHAADGYDEAIPLDLVEREDILIAYGMGERTLATEHGFPARLLVPGRYGMKMTKWIDRIEVRNESHEAYWAERGWDEEAIVNTTSYVRGAERDGDLAVVGGVAFGGLETGVEEIEAVEVSVDGGANWNDAEVEDQLAAHAWRRWRYEFDPPEPGELDVVVRAIRRDGTVQTGEESSPRPGGATGWHRRTVSPE